MVIRITNPACIDYLRSNMDSGNTQIVETAMCRVYGIIPRQFKHRRNGRPKAAEKFVAVKILDKRLLKMLRQTKESCGISHHFAVENALLNNLQKRSEVADA